MCLKKLPRSANLVSLIHVIEIRVVNLRDTRQDRSMVDNRFDNAEGFTLTRNLLVR